MPLQRHKSFGFTKNSSHTAWVQGGSQGIGDINEQIFNIFSFNYHLEIIVCRHELRREALSVPDTVELLHLRPSAENLYLIQRSPHRVADVQ